MADRPHVGGMRLLRDPLPLAEASMRHHNPPIVIQHRNRVVETAYAA